MTTAVMLNDFLTSDVMFFLVTKSDICFIPFLQAHNFAKWWYHDFAMIVTIQCDHCGHDDTSCLSRSGIFVEKDLDCLFWPRLFFGRPFRVAGIRTHSQTAPSQQAPRAFLLFESWQTWLDRQPARAHSNFPVKQRFMFSNLLQTWTSPFGLFSMNTPIEDKQDSQ